MTNLSELSVKAISNLESGHVLLTMWHNEHPLLDCMKPEPENRREKMATPNETLFLLT